MKFTAKFLSTRPMPEEWKADLEKMQGKALSMWPEAQQLREKLLAMGGEEVLFAPGGRPIDASDVTRLLSRGKYWPGARAQTIQMRHNQCHSNSRELWEKGYGDVVNGFAIDDDGLWRVHSWVRTKNALIETTVPRLGYFGAVLTKEEVESEYGS